MEREGGGNEWSVDLKFISYTVTTFFSNYKAGAVWLSLRGILGRARGTREGERRTPLLFSHCTSSTFLLLSPRPPPPKKMASATQSMIGYGEGTYSLEFMRVSKQRNEPAGDGPGAGVRLCYTGSSIMSSKMYKRRHLREFQTMISSSMRKLHYGHL